jgi:hypothetical protein
MAPYILVEAYVIDSLDPPIALSADCHPLVVEEKRSEQIFFDDLRVTADAMIGTDVPMYDRFG